MLDNANIRKDFPMLQKTMQSHPLVYLDSGATTLKPRQVIDAVVNYYENYGANAHRGDYDLSYFVDQEYEQTRKDVAAFLHAADAREIVYTSGASSALNLVAYGYGRKFLQRGDIILTSVAEHASCVLPWMRVAQECGAVVQYVPLDAQGRITLEAVASMMNERVRVVALAHISNVLGYLAPMREICELAHRYGAVVVVDGAQSVPHIPLDVVAMDCDFLAFSAHKMCGPTGIGILYGKLELLDAMDPLYLGGDSNARFDMCGNIQLKNAPYKFESGTQPYSISKASDERISTHGKWSCMTMRSVSCAGWIILRYTIRMQTRASLPLMLKMYLHRMRRPSSMRTGLPCAADSTVPSC